MAASTAQPFLTELAHNLDTIQDYALVKQDMSSISIYPNASVIKNPAMFSLS
jgi:hypothetical protein